MIVFHDSLCFCQTAIRYPGRPPPTILAHGSCPHLYQSADWRPTFLNEFGSQGIGDGQFEYPNGVAVDSRDRVYVTDRENNRVQVWGY